MRNNTEQAPKPEQRPAFLVLPLMDDASNSWLLVSAMAGMALIMILYRQIKLQKELRRARQLSWNLQAVIIHEIRTPFCAIVKLLTLARQAPPGQPNTQELLLAAQNSARLLLELLDDMLTQSKLQMGRLILNLQPTNLETLVRDLAQNYTPIAMQQNIRLLVTTDCPLPYLHIDILRIRQILSNLLSNAFKFTQQGQIGVNLRTRPGREGMARVDIQVSDTGIGMTPEALSELFTLFSASGEATRQRFGGHGLGLCLCQQLTHLMNGQIHVDSQPGMGTRIDLSFEFALASAQNAGMAMLNLVGVTALIADDDQANQMLLKRQLEQHSLTVICCGNGEQALRIWAQSKIDIIFCDMHMPELNGVELIKRIRRLERRLGRARTPIVGISADQTRPMAESGVDTCANKPLSREELERSLRYCLPHHPGEMRPQRVQYEILRQLSQGDMAFEYDFLRSVLETNRADLEKMLVAHANHDLEQLGESLHRIKSVLRLLCGEALCNQCMALEKAVRARDLEQINPLLPALAREINAVNDELELHQKR